MRWRTGSVAQRASGRSDVFAGSVAQGPRAMASYSSRANSRFVIFYLLQSLGLANLSKLLATEYV